MSKGPKTHELKCRPEPFQAVLDGHKMFEWRKDDRGYEVGDTLRLREWDTCDCGGIVPECGGPGVCVEVGACYTGRECTRTVTYIIREGLGISDGYCIIGINDATQGKVLTDEEIERIVLSVDFGSSRRDDGLIMASSWGNGVRSGLEYARYHGYLSPKGLTVDEVIEVVKGWLFKISNCENEEERNDPAFKEAVRVLKSALEAKLNQHTT